MTRLLGTRCLRLLCFSMLLWATTAAVANAEDVARTSRTIGAVLREPTPPETLDLTEDDVAFTVAGPTFRYRVPKATGVISAIQVRRDGQTVVESCGPVDLQIDDRHFGAAGSSCKVSAVRRGKDKVVLRAEGVLRESAGSGPEIDYSIDHTFFNDGVVVSSVALKPKEDLAVKSAIASRLRARGRFSHYFHKKRDEHGADAERGCLPGAGKAVSFTTLTSCCQVFSAKAGLAIFTDCGATHVSRQNLETAAVEVAKQRDGMTPVRLSQYLVRVAPGDEPYTLKAHEEFRFRTGISIAPNRLPQPRMHDLRMFTWLGDGTYPYPTDQEIDDVARLGFTVFQMHRLGTLGEPRPPAGELNRVIDKVHRSGMLFLWAENADLMYASAPGVEKQMAAGRWPLWQGFNYGGRYKAGAFDPYCDMVATCLASPNGLAQYRLDCIGRMMDRFAVDGIYLDDNLAYGNCTLWQQHQHPRPVYDCLIELHEINWQRRQLMLSRRPHAVLVDHCTTAFVLPLMCDFDASLYGEGYSFGSMEDYWNNYLAPVMSVPSQGMVWPGDDEPDFCSAADAYIFDLLSGGGQYTTIDWRLYSKKFSHAVGVSDREPLYMKTYNLAQYYFGLYESTHEGPLTSAERFATTTPATYAAIYRNRVWDDLLIVVANMSKTPNRTSLEIRKPRAFGILPKNAYTLFDIHRRTARQLVGSQLNDTLRDLSLAGKDLGLFCLRAKPADAPYHVWGGKRIAENWDGDSHQLSLTIDGPAGLKETVYIGAGNRGVRQVLVAGKPSEFFLDSAQGLVHGNVTFTSEPLKIDVICSPDGANGLPKMHTAEDLLGNKQTKE